VLRCLTNGVTVTACSYGATVSVDEHQANYVVFLNGSQLASVPISSLHSPAWAITSQTGTARRTVNATITDDNGDCSLASSQDGLSAGTTVSVTGGSTSAKSHIERKSTAIRARCRSGPTPSHCWTVRIVCSHRSAEFERQLRKMSLSGLVRPYGAAIRPSAMRSQRSPNYGVHHRPNKLPPVAQRKMSTLGAPLRSRSVL
jgi:hypothetical protein